MLNEYLMIGEVLKPQGVRGEAKIRPYTDDPEAFRRWKTLYLEAGGVYTPVAAACSRVHDGFAYVTLAGCAKPEDVEKLRGRKLYIDRAHAAPLPEGEVYIADLIGCEAVDEKGQHIGRVTDVLQHGPVDVYVFDTPRGEMLAPALKAVFPETDVAARRLTVDSERLAEVAVYAS
ncbi:MAG: 16S rRNA processing protein RimM [Clostridia bacterium]|nr:16S rRNA processing protein RimM [Clostridia bacterium]